MFMYVCTHAQYNHASEISAKNELPTKGITIHSMGSGGFYYCGVAATFRNQGAKDPTDREHILPPQVHSSPPSILTLLITSVVLVN